MYYLLLGGGVILGYNYSDNIKEWGIKQNKYISNYFKKKDFIYNLIKIEKIVYIELNNKYEIKEKFFINIETLEEDFLKIIEYINKNLNNNISYLMIEYSTNNSDNIYRFNYPINKENFEEKIINFKKNFKLDDINNNKNIPNVEDENLSFLNNYQNNNITLKIISIDYINNDITKIIKSYAGLNQDFHTLKIDFRYLLDDNYNLIFNKENNLNIIKDNLDIIELNLEENNYLFISNLY